MKRVFSVLLALVICFSCVSITVSAKRDFSYEEVLAKELKELGLFRGVSETNFDLGRAPTRVEALVMLIRVLGKETQAMEGNWEHPFTDVPSWANKYVGYAYENGLTNGQSATSFGTSDANAAMYLTFVLRALGYSDKGGLDFTWDNPFSLARQTGILTEDVYLEEFLRADVVIVSHNALASYIIGSEITLASKLIDANVFTKELFESVYNSHINITDKEDDLTPEIPVPDIDPTLSQDGFTAEAVFEKFSPSVFYIEVYDAEYIPYALGSGFFIDDKGTAVTNFHVLEGAHYAVIQLSDTREVFEIKGVYDYSVENDWAVIQVDCSGNNYLERNTERLVGGAKVYAIGSPHGLQNTISEGIVSNPQRIVNGIDYIQFTASISSGSSGGALLDKNGKVVGITSAAFDAGQNLNLAVPISYIDNYKKDVLHNLWELPGYDTRNVPNIEYILSDNSVYVSTGETKFISLTCIEEYFDETVNFCVTSGNEKIAYVDWANYEEEDYPWDIAVYGVNTGTTYLKVYNKSNDQYIMIPIFVDAREPQTPYDNLKKFVIDNGFADSDCITLTYDQEYSEDGQYMEYFLEYDIPEDFLFVGCVYYDQGMAWYTQTSLLNTTGYLTYSSIFIVDGMEYFFMGEFNPYFMKHNTRLYWQDTNCPSELRETLIAAAAIMISEMMVKFDDFVTYEVGGYTAADFGFYSTFLN